MVLDTPLVIYCEDTHVKYEDALKLLESPKIEDKRKILKRLITLATARINVSRFLFHVIKNCMKNEYDHKLKKLVMLFWEIVDKYDEKGKLHPEVILICNAFRQDLNHANEYVRGSTLRLLCQFKDLEILQPVIGAVTLNLEHRNVYVRKNAILALSSIIKNHPDLIPDAVPLVEKFLRSETSSVAQRNAFILLFSLDQNKSMELLPLFFENIGTLDESFQLVIMDIIRKLSRSYPFAKSQFNRILYILLNQGSPSVRFEAASTLLSLGIHPTSISSSIQVFTDLLSSLSDPNIQLIILNRLLSLKEKHEKVMSDCLLDLIRVLSSPSLDLRSKTLELIFDLLSEKYVSPVVQYLKKELQKYQNLNTADTISLQYISLLLDYLFRISLKFPNVIDIVIPLLSSSLTLLSSPELSEPILAHLRKIIEGFSSYRSFILNSLLEILSSLHDQYIIISILWLLGEYITDRNDIEKTFSSLFSLIGPLPIFSDGSLSIEPHSIDHSSISRTKTVILSDGTYGASEEHNVTTTVKESLRSLIQKGQWFLVSCLANSLTKLLFHYGKETSYSKTDQQYQHYVAQNVLLLTHILRCGPSQPTPLDPDTNFRLRNCIIVSFEPLSTQHIFLSLCRESYRDVITTKSTKTQDRQRILYHCDDNLSIRHFQTNQNEINNDENDVQFADNNGEDYLSTLSFTQTLSGYSDSLYAEALIRIKGYDVVVEYLVINQTPQTLTNVTLEIFTSDDLNIHEKPPSFTLTTKSSQRFSCVFKILEIKNATINGNITFDTPQCSEKRFVLMKTLNIDITQLIIPSSTTLNHFRQMWLHFEWENNIILKTSLMKLSDYLQQIINLTHLKLLNNEDAESLNNDNSFLSANLYATTIFHEECLMNISLERTSTEIVGTIRIRARNKGLAYSIGNKINEFQNKKL